MRKYRIYDLLIVIFVYVGLSCFPVNLFHLSQTVEALIQIVLEVIAFIFLLFFNEKSTVKIKLSKAKMTNLLLFIPTFIVCFSNFFCLLLPRCSINSSNSFDTLIVLLPYAVLSLFVALNEELIFRCILLGNFFEEKHYLIRIVLASLVFAACHLTHFLSSFDPLALVVVLYTFGIGIILGMMYLSNGGFVLCLLFHFLYNFINNYLVNTFLVIDDILGYYLINIGVAVIVGIYLFLIYKFNFKKKLQTE